MQPLRRDGEANRKLLAFLAEVLDIDLSRLEIVAGENGLDKIISVLDMPSDVAEKSLSTGLKIRRRTPQAGLKGLSLTASVSAQTSFFTLVSLHGYERIPHCFNWQWVFRLRL